MTIIKLVLVFFIGVLFLQPTVAVAGGLMFVETADSRKSKNIRKLVQWTHSRLVFNKVLERIAVGQEETLQIEVLSKNEALVLAKKVGRTSVMVWYSDQTSETFLFTVTSDLSVLHHAVKDIHPNISLTLAPDRDALVLRGKVPTIKYRIAAEAAARNYFEAGQGRSPSGVPGFLYKETFEACPMPEIIGGIGSPIGSRYISQKVITGEPCESPFNLPTSQGQPALTCQASEVKISTNNGQGNGGKDKITLGICDAGCGTDAQLQCGCPSGYYSVSGGSVDGQCCPTGTDYDDPSFCTGLSLKKAESVININDPTQNALEQFTSPFQVNLPELGGRVDGDQWFNTAPNGE